MYDPDQEYPRHQHGSRDQDRDHDRDRDRDDHQHHDPFAIREEGELEEEKRPRRGRFMHQREEATLPELPHRHGSKAVLIGAIAGLLSSAQGIVLTLANSDLYRQAAGYMSMGQEPASLAAAIAGLFFLGLGISTLIYFIGGLIIGRVAVHRRWAFIGGFVGGAISEAIGAILKQIPSYPNAGNTGFSGGALGIGGGLIALLIGIVLLSILTGLVSLFGAWLTTRRHPYYVGYGG